MKCKTCRQPFEKRLPMQSVCSPNCALSLAISKRGKAEKVAQIKEKKEDRKRKAALKTRSDYIKEAREAFHKFVRLRDYGKTCISCSTVLGDPAVGGAYDAGHWRSVGSAPHLRFDERNVHGQCKRCNRWGSGMAVDYRRGLLGRFGLGLVEALEADQEPRRHTVDDLKAIKAKYRALANQLEKQR
jgi:hypothetical protein